MPFPLLWKALRYFDQDPEQFMASLGRGPRRRGAGEAARRAAAQVAWTSTPRSLQRLSAEPKLAGTVAALFNLYKNTRTQLENVLAQLSSRATRTGPRGAAADGRALRLLALRRGHATSSRRTTNYFPELEEQAEALRRDFRLERQLTSQPAGRGCSRTASATGWSLRPVAGSSSVVRRLDPETQTLTLSPDADRAAAEVPARRVHRPAGDRPGAAARAHPRRQRARATPRRRGSSRSTSPTTSPAR